MTEEKCIFGCDPPKSEPMINVEMNRSKDGTFADKPDTVNQAKRVSGVAHESCYRDWYEATYKVPFG